MQKDAVLITGANGEIGHGLIDYLGEECDVEIVAFDIQPLDKELACHCQTFIQGNVLDMELIKKIGKEYNIKTIFHLASLLSTKAEHVPELAHDINVNGTMNLIKMAIEQGNKQDRSIKFIYPSSIAAYGIPGLDEKQKAGAVKEEEYLQPTTMYGINKLYCENLGRYYTNFYGQINPGSIKHLLDFRCLRFPGLISSVTLPTGGTTDYGPEMLHHAAQNKPYACFVRPDTKLPFMVMDDAIKSLIDLEDAPKEKLSQMIYNVTSFSPTAEEFVDVVKGYFPNAEISFELDPSRQKFVDTWPADIDDSAARKDWGWTPDYDQKRAFDELLIPAVRNRYK